MKKSSKVGIVFKDIKKALLHFWGNGESINYILKSFMGSNIILSKLISILDYMQMSRIIGYSK